MRPTAAPGEDCARAAIAEVDVGAQGAMAEVDVVFGDVESKAQDCHDTTTPTWLRSDSDDFQPVKRLVPIMTVVHGLNR
jgi:hypothetical protein